MRNRHERRKAAATSKKKVARLNIPTFAQHFDGVLRNVRAVFERTGEIRRPGFECVADGEIFHVPAHWPDRGTKHAAYAPLRDCFRRRGVNRYLFVNEGWVGKTPGLLPTDDPARGECVHVIAVERNGPRRFAFAEITRNGGTATLGQWEVTGDIPAGWLFELLEEGHSDRAPRAERSSVGKMSMPDFQDLASQHPEQVAEFRDSFEIHSQLRGLIADQLQKDANGDPKAIFLALESVLRSIVQDMGSPNGIGEFARFLRDHPDKFPMFSTVPDQVSSTRHVRSCEATLRRFSCEKRELGLAPSAIFLAFMNTYMSIGSQTIGAVHLADRIENWDPEYLAKLRQVGLRSSSELLDYEEGIFFLALSAERFPLGVIGRRNAIGELFVSEIVGCPHDDFPTALDDLQQQGFELVLGSEAKELLCKLEQVGIAPRADKPKENLGS
jgi:hypothetical protein